MLIRSPLLPPDSSLLAYVVAMEDERNEFYVIQKGDIIGIYRDLHDFQDHAGSSVDIILPLHSALSWFFWPIPLSTVLTEYLLVRILSVESIIGMSRLRASCINGEPKPWSRRNRLV